MLTSTFPDTLTLGLVLDTHQFRVASTEPLGLAITVPLAKILLKCIARFPVLYIVPPVPDAVLFSKLVPVIVKLPALLMAPPLPVTLPLARVKPEMLTVEPLVMLNNLPSC